MHLREKTNKKTVRLGEFNELAYEVMILAVNTGSSVGKVAFGLMKNAKSEDFLEGNCNVAWDRLLSMLCIMPGLCLS